MGIPPLVWCPSRESPGAPPWALSAVNSSSLDNNVDKKFQIQDFTSEIIRDASQMVGRFEDQNKIEEAVKSLNEGVIWLTGTAGIGKSFLSARLMRDLEENNQNTNNYILFAPYTDV